MQLTDAFAPAARSFSTPARRARLWPILGVGLLLLVLLLSAISLLRARRHLLAGAHILNTAAASVSHPALWRSPRTRQTLRLSLLRAQDEFAAARADLRILTPLLGRLGWFPLVGGQLAAAAPAADTAYFTTRATLHLFDGLAPIWSTGPHAGLTLVHAVPVLSSGSPQFRAALADADRAASALRRLSGHSGSAALDASAQKLRRELPVLRASASWLLAAPAVLGVQQPSHYLVVFQDPAELRATGGFIGAAGYLTVRAGRVRDTFTGSVLPHEVSSISTPLPEALYTPEGSLIFRDSNWSPDVPLSSRLERWFYGEDTGRWADGVISLVDTGVADLLAASGPVYLPAYHQWVNANNVQALAQRYVNGSYKGPLQQGYGDTVRKQFFGWVLQAILQRFQALPADRWTALLPVLSRATAHRDIALYDRRPRVEAAIHRSGADGSFAYTSGDYLAVVDDNRSYNKLNPYVHETASYRASIRPDLWLDATLTLRYHVDPSPATLEGGGPGLGWWGTKHDYQDFLRVYVPPGAQLLATSGIDRWAPKPAYGFTQLAGRLIVREGTTHVVTLRYRVPPNTFGNSPGRYTLTVRRQPGADLTGIRAAVTGQQGVTVGSGAAQPRFLSLTEDVHLRLPLGGILHPRPITLAKPTGPIDPYLPFTDFHDPRHPL